MRLKIIGILLLPHLEEAPVLAVQIDRHRTPRHPSQPQPFGQTVAIGVAHGRIGPIISHISQPQTAELLQRSPISEPLEPRKQGILKAPASAAVGPRR